MSEIAEARKITRKNNHFYSISYLFKSFVRTKSVIFIQWGWFMSTQRLYTNIIQRFSRAGPRGRGREWATLGVHPLSWLLSNNRLEEVCGTLTKGTFSSRLLLSNQDKRCAPSVDHSLPLPLPPGFCSTCLMVIYAAWWTPSDGFDLVALKHYFQDGCDY